MSQRNADHDVLIAAATERDIPVLHRLIAALAEYEHLAHEVVATEHDLRDALFGVRPHAEAVIASVGPEQVGFALWFHNYSTFVGRPGLYLEDLFVLPAWRGRGVGRALIVRLAQIAVERRCGRMEWAVLDWNETAIRFYRSLGAGPMDEWTVFRVTGDALQKLADSAAR